MGIFQWLYGSGKPVKEYKEAPSKGIGLYFYILRTYFWKMLQLNILFVLFCLPIITIPAALSASYRVYIKLTKDGYCLIFGEYWKEFRQHFGGRLLVFFFLSVPPLSIAACAHMLGYASVAVGLLFAFSVISFLAQTYFFIIEALIELPVGLNLRNAFILCFLEWKSTLLLLATAGVWYAICALMFPYSLPVLLLITFSAGQLGACVCLLPGIERRLVRRQSDS